MKTRLQIAALASSLALIAGCGVVAPHWIEGQWVLDDKTTSSVNNDIQEEGVGPVLGALKRIAGGAVEELHKSFLDDSTIEFTGGEVRTMEGGGGYTTTYEIIEKPDPDTAVIKKGDGSITTYHREGEKVWFNPSPDLDLRIYLKRPH